ncbi:glycosyltransferase family A protein [Piscinibacter sp. HJYY11]|uniref:glycosyltransferase family 2 protein n=1 Tax=Piscinibacter sp. HJYY11 TaxID=2801333 RepID=UPI00191F02F9|nr:glycosyltransferase family A protein [Piscinibacter sp. HJYY11]MBL0727340.1 glycosyltransferase [Piscinibacter sp. HJYY11]
MPHAPFFSVITATHLRSPLLARNLRSLRAQTFQDFELIVVADALDVGTATVCAELLREQDVFIKRGGRRGPAESRNVGMSLARGEWVVFLDDDDTFAPDHLQNAHARITAGPAAKVLFSDFDVLTEDRSKDLHTALSRNRVSLAAQPIESLHVKNFIPNNALVFHRMVLEGVTVDPHLESQEDWDFLLAVCQKAMPVHYEGGGAIVHKDYVNPGTRRGTSTAANDATVVVDFLHTYRRWRAPTPELQAQRQQLMQSVGLALPTAWL